MNSSATNTYAEQLRKREQAFLTARISNEQLFQKWINGCRALPEEIKSQLPIDVNTVTIQSLVPECYKDDMTEATINSQIDTVNNIIEQVNKIILAYNEKAYQLCQKMDAMAGGGLNAGN
jgi:hypothetical protein